jgi:hypothetical protein
MLRNLVRVCGFLSVLFVVFSANVCEAATSSWFWYSSSSRSIRVNASVQKPTPGIVIEDGGDGWCGVAYRTSHWVEVTKNSGLVPHQFQLTGELEVWNQVYQRWEYYPDQTFWNVMPTTLSATWAAYQWWNPQNNPGGYLDTMPRNTNDWNRHQIQSETYGYDTDANYVGTSIAQRANFGCR